METPRFADVRACLGGAGVRAWVTGGTVRDLLLGREPHDFDLVVSGDPEPVGRRFANVSGGSFFLLSEDFKTCRVLSPDRQVKYDFTALRGDTIEADLAQRDFTANAVAVELAADPGLIDPLGGQADIENRRLAAVSPGIIDDDPLRLLRAVRLEKTTGLVIDSGLADLIKAQAKQAAAPAAERTFAELVIVLELPGTDDAVRRLDELGLLKILLPELEALKGVEQNQYHHLDVFEHTLAHAHALGHVIAEPAGYFPADAEWVRERCRLRVAGDASWLFIMGFASIMHDIAKPGCAFTDGDGRIRFFEHDRRGSEMAAEIIRRFRASSKCVDAVSSLVDGHMRFEGLLQQPEPTARARLRYLRATDPYSPELIIMSVADRLSVRGPLVTEADIERHLLLAREMMTMCHVRAEAEPLPRLISGDELMRELGLQAGPLIGRLVERISEEQQLGNISTREQALSAAAAMLAEESS